ncbi:TetR/AcrR family transcriptional regulator [Pseudonocardia sp. CA-107938]|uniref:TetR/AcrR family transcriptional regulator n=1 Tax=Pseudonocardia sp. CA-107938 TaxID=3240021 RepID=UPI003D8EF495
MASSARTRPARPALSRAGIVATALAVCTADGIAAVTMRRVARELDTAAASLYVYVADRDELVAAAHDLAVADVELPTSADGSWRDRLELLVERTAAALAARGDIAVVGLTGTPGPAALRVIDEMVRLLRTAGLPALQCAWAVDLLGKHIAAAALEDRTGGAPRVDDVESYPALAEIATVLTDGDPATRAAWKLGVLLDGLERRASPQVRRG